MNIETSKVKSTQKAQQAQPASVQVQDSAVKFTDELNDLKSGAPAEEKPVNTSEQTELSKTLDVQQPEALTLPKDATTIVAQNIQASIQTKRTKQEVSLEISTEKEVLLNQDLSIGDTSEEILPAPTPLADLVQSEINKKNQFPKNENVNIFAEKPTEAEIISETNILPLKPDVSQSVSATESPVKTQVVIADILETIEPVELTKPIVVAKPIETIPPVEVALSVDLVQPVKPEVSLEVEVKQEEVKVPHVSNKDIVKTELTVEEEIAKPLDTAVTGLSTIVQELNKKNILNQSEEIVSKPIKDITTSVDEEKEGDELINNEINIQENKEVMPQMSANMSFNSDGQPFSSFMNEENKENKTQSILGNKAQDLAEEAAILSTMAENVAIANKNNIAKAKQTVEKPAEVKKPSPLVAVFDDTVEPEVKTITREDGIKKVDTKTGVTVENVVKFDNVIMNQADVEVFTTLVQNGQVDMNNLAPEAAQKAVQVSKNLADMLAKAQETQQPVRIDFDNDISVIIRISKDGKVSAEFLPSSQIAEAYLRENLPLLRQKFDDNNIKYDDLSQRNQRDNREKENNRKKGRNDE